MKIKNITVLYNQAEILAGEGRESDVDTQESATLVADALESAGYKTEMMQISRNDIYKVSKINADLVFNLVEWTGVDIESGIRVAETLRKSGLKFTGSDKKGLMITGNKVLMKKLFKKFRIPTAKWKINEEPENIVLNGLTYPVITKPSFEHCGMGIEQDSVSNTLKEAKVKIREMIKKYEQPILTEEYIPGREIQATIIDRGGVAGILPPAEVEFSDSNKYLPILTYAAKWVPGEDEYSASTMKPAVLDKKYLTEINRIAAICYRNFEAWDYARLDMRIDAAGNIKVLELNNNPGIDFDILSGIGISARMASLTFPQLVDRIVKNAYLRFEQPKNYAAL